MSIKLNKLKPEDPADPIQVRIYQKWINSIPPNPKPIGYCCILLDKEGNAIQANMDFVDKDYFDRLIELNGCYKISNYICERAKTWNMTIPHITTLKFGKHTKFEQITDEAFPSHYFNFLSYNQLLPRVNENHILTDYMASLRKVNDIDKSGNPNKNTNVWRILELENLIGDTIKVTIWNEMARNFDVEAFKCMPKPVLIAISSCRVTMYKEKLQLTATPSTHYYLNPDIEDAQISLPEYQAKYEADPPLDIRRQPFNNLELEKTRNRNPLKTLLKINPKPYMTDKFTTEATIVNISSTHDWFYIACPDCSRKLKRTNQMLECHNHGPITKDPKHLYTIKAFISDDTAQIPVTFFSPVADSLINIECNKMVIELGYTDKRTLPDPILKLKGTKKIFQFHYNQRSVSGNVDFVLDKVMDITPQDETQCMESQEQGKHTASTPNKRKSGFLINTGKHMKREIIEEQATHEQDPYDGKQKQ